MLTLASGILQIVLVLIPSFTIFAEQGESPDSGGAVESGENEAQAEVRSSLAQKVFERVKPSVFQIKTALNPKAPKSSYGSGFVVDKDEGLVITNYHVVASSIQEEKDYKLYLIDGEETYKATVVGLNVVNDVALLKVHHKFNHELHLAARPPIQGAKIFSVGIPLDLNMAITEGNFNGIIREGPYGRIHMASPLNSGMSGGPTVDRDGRVVGINVSVFMFSQSVSFSVPNEYIGELLAAYRAGKSAEPDEIHSVIEQQLLKVQKNLIDDIAENQGAKVEIGEWSVPKSSKLLRCWSGNDDQEENLYLRTAERCYLNEASYIHDGVLAGSYEVGYRVYSTSKLSYWQLLNVAGQEVTSSLLENIVLGEQTKEDLLTHFDCGETKIVNGHKVPFIVRYCLRGYTHYPQIFNAEFKAFSLVRNNKILIVTGVMAGFAMENVKTFISNLLQEIHLVEPRGH